MAGTFGINIEKYHKTITKMALGEKIIEVKIIEIEVEVETMTEIITGVTIEETVILVEIEVG